MKKSTITAFLMILATISFFNSKFYYHKILNRKHPVELTDKKEKKTQNNIEEKNNITENAAVDKKKGDDNKYALEDKKDVIEQSRPQKKDSITENDTLWVETDDIICGIIESGARVISIKTKGYSYNDEENNGYIELVDDKKAGACNLKINGNTYDDKKFKIIKPSTSRKVYVREKEKKTITLRYENGENEIIEKNFVFKNKGYVFDLYISSPFIQEKNVTVGIESGIRKNKEESGRMARYSMREMHLLYDDNIEHLKHKKEEDSERNGYYKWVGLSSKYFLVSIITKDIYDAQIKISSFFKENEGKKDKNDINYSFEWSRLSEKKLLEYSVYAGPKKLDQLKEKNIGLQKVMFKGYRWFFFADMWFPPLCEGILWLLTVLKKVVFDYGIVIILLTVMVRLVTYPLTQSSMKSMSRMKEIQPKMESIKQKYKSNPKKMNEQMMALYKKEGVNPLNPGCLPIFLQMPIFISLFIVLQKAIELRGAGTILIPWINDLSKPEVLFSLPVDIPLYGNNFALLPIVMAIFTYFQNKMTIKDPNQKMMIYFMPAFMLVLFNNFPSGLVIYWTFSSVLQLVQQIIIEKKKQISK